MIDKETNKPIAVDISEGGYAGLSLPFEQLDRLRALFDANKVEYWVEDEVLSINDGPEIATVGFQPAHRSEGRATPAG